MRCLGLTSERKRCEAQAVDGASYCEAHQGTARLNSATSAAPGADTGVAGLWKKLRETVLAPRGRDEVQFDAPAWLKNSPTPTVVEHLLHYSDATVRWAAAFTLRKRRDPATLEPLWEALQHDPSSAVRQQVAVALGKLGPLTTLGPLIEGLWHDPDAGVRQACVIALGNLGTPAVAQDLAGALEREPAIFVRWDCIIALGQLGNSTVEPMLAELADKERAAAVRQACRQALAAIRRRANDKIEP